MLDLNSLDLEEIANALADQTDYEHLWLINPHTGQVAFWTADTGIDGQTPVDPDELGLVGIDPLPSWVWYQDMADFAETITDERAGRRLARAIQGKGAFRRLAGELHDEYRDRGKGRRRRCGRGGTRRDQAGPAAASRPIRSRPGSGRRSVAPICTQERRSCMRNTVHAGTEDREVAVGHTHQDLIPPLAAVLPR